MKPIVRDYQFADFAAALKFVNKVAVLAEEANHHPDIHIIYNQVHLTFWTHSAKAVTDKDFSLAEKIDKMAK